VSPSAPGMGLGRGLCPAQKLYLIFELKMGEFWCILGLIKPTFDRPDVSIFLASSRLGGKGAIAPPVDPPLSDSDNESIMFTGCLSVRPRSFVRSDRSCYHITLHYNIS